MDWISPGGGRYRAPHGADKVSGSCFKLASFFFDAFSIGHDKKTEISQFSKIRLEHLKNEKVRHFCIGSKLAGLNFDCKNSL